MESLTYDLVILRASGFTGKYSLRSFLLYLIRPPRYAFPTEYWDARKSFFETWREYYSKVTGKKERKEYVDREALKFFNNPSSSSSSSSAPLKTIGLAGRNPDKLAQALKWASHPDPPPPISILIADTTDPSSLRRLCQQTKLILNCVGPFRLHGDPVVAACAETGCDYLDICGEPDFMERTEAKYHEKAVETGSLMISACGFDSVPAEFGWMFNSRQWVPPAAPNQIEAYLSLESNKKIVGNLGTYESAILGVANADKLMELRRSRPKRARPVIPGPYPPKGSTIDHQKEMGLWAVKLPSADSVVVRRTLATLAENPNGLRGANESTEQIKKRETFWSTIKPAHFGVKLGAKSLMGVYRFIVVGVLLGLLGRNAIGRWLLFKFPSFFSLGWFRKKGPSEDEVNSASFKMWFVGRGFSDVNTTSEGNMKPDMEIVTRVMGPEIGYLTTPIILIQCALVLLRQRDSLPKGGVFTPGIVFGATDLQERLEQNGLSFDIISKRMIPSA